MDYFVFSAIIVFAVLYSKSEQVIEVVKHFVSVTNVFTFFFIFFLHNNLLFKAQITKLHMSRIIIVNT